jgi:uncharacterized protein (TIGR03435 family)
MAQLAERLRGAAPGLTSAVLDATGIEGGWDFTLSFNQLPQALNGPGRGGDSATPGAIPQASDPSGGYTVFEALEKQLGLKLEKRQRTMPVIVIDHMERKPTD